jgi:integrase
MAVYKKGKGTWRVVIHHPKLPNGREDRVIRGMKRDAEQFEARRKAEVEAADPIEIRTAPKFSDFCVTRYRPHAETHLKGSTWTKQRYVLATLVEHLGDQRLTELTVHAVEEFKSARLRAGLKPISVNNELRVLVRLVNFAHEMQVPCARPKIRYLKERGSRPIEPWTLDEVNGLMDATARVSPDILPLIVGVANTGVRKGEAIALRSAWVDLKQGVVRVQAVPDDDDEDWSPKDEEWRAVPINEALMAWLTADRLSRTWIFPSARTGGRYAYWPQKQFDRARDAAGLKGGVHRLRHFYATMMVQKTRDLLLVARILGHSHERVTELYAHLLPDHLKVAREAFSVPAPVGPSQWAARNAWGDASVVRPAEAEAVDVADASTDVGRA